MSLDEVARLAGKHTSQLSRLERQDARGSHPKQETIEEILDALGATPDERKAVFHVESPPVTPEEIEAQVAAIDAEYGSSSKAIVLIDDRWYRRYLNLPARKLFAIDGSDYSLVITNHALLDHIDPASPIYKSFPEEDRKSIFSTRVAAFQFSFAEQQFDNWYLQLADQIGRVFWAWQIWQSPPDVPPFPDNQDLPLLHPVEGKLMLRAQLNRMLLAPRFTFIEMTAVDSESAEKMARIIGA